MKRACLLAAAAAICLILSGPVPAQEDLSGRAAGIVRELSLGEFEQVYESFETTMKAQLPAAKLAEVWNTVIAQAGPFQSQGKPTLSKAGAFDVAVVPCRFQHALLDVQVTFDAQRQVGGLFFLPPGTAALQPPKVAQPPPSTPGEIHEVEVTVGAGEWALPGTLSLPSGQGPFPAVVLVHGSGPQDRDSTVGACAPFRDLAHALAAKGVAVLRYEKRTKHYAEKMASSVQQITVREETIDDALAAVSLLRMSPSIRADRVFVAGHSLGGMLAPRIASLDPEIAGIILLAAPARPLQELVLEQLAYIASLGGPNADEVTTQLALAKKAAARLNDLSNPESNDPKDWLLGGPDGYWRHLAKYSQTQMAQQIRQPTLLLQGERDYQVTRKDYDLWKAALANRSNVTFRLYPGLNHLFVAGEGHSTPAEYATPGVVAGQVPADIAEWVKSK